MTQPDPQFEQLLLYLKESRGFDFTGYKRSSLMRRVGRRMAQVSVPDYAEYLDYLEVHPEEFTALFNTILINVTSFFRDVEAWDHLRTEVIPALLAAKETGAPIRVWSAGCASGEEAYSLAIMLSEILGVDEFRHRVKIYATDVDEEGLTAARHASYSERDLAGMPPELLERYFEASANRHVFRKDLRRSVIFGRNDLVQDAPISRIDLLVCRNALMYFNAETQSRILSRFHFALGRGGVLFLGKAEMLLSHANLFTPIDLKRRIFRKVLPAHATTGGYLSEMPPALARDELVGLDRLRGEAFTASPVAQVVLTSDGLVALSNRQAETMFGVSTKDLGRPFRDLDLSYRPVELRGLIEQAQVERRMHRLTDVEFLRAPGETVHLEVQINPLVNNDASLLGVSLIFLDVTAAYRLQEDLEHANRQLETAYEELQSTNEELETTNEELQSTVEELETTNEELQSTNEELETMNEELQSTNDELQSINDELRDRTGELDTANAFLEAILTSLRAGVAVVDQDMHLQAWNRRAEDLWGLRRDEAVGQHLLNLDIGLPTDQLRPAIKRVLTGEPQPQELTLPAVNRRGRAIDVRVVCSALARDNGSALGVILVMDPTGDDGQPLTAP
ncbi:CheR family methyltransferase [Amorphoplanes digitatis]|uniref:protein-glutamate O-methyltransferase n=1 Tax=Actinoplanes digitatis TaxID=1868 RepID=A0A7W7HW33_9ACTN|nr:CheR family methyltransferase [Actinoplanes digitatis]MBB4761789.1 two-component system CheB/CheR fusion protein [Actinoplanes digitatis]GID90900.1 chemotaxis protein CheR [Actinoplanes digitatis]